MKTPFAAAFLALASGLHPAAMASPAQNLNPRECPAPDINRATLDLIEEFEGWRPSPYLDPGNEWTIGYGHLCDQARECREIPGIPLTKEAGDNLLQSDLMSAKNCITMATKTAVVLNANQYGALVSWAFNVGCGAAGDSDLIRRLNNGEDPGVVASSELPQWNKIGTQVSAGLTRRRGAEVNLFKTPTPQGALPVPCT